MTKANIDDLFTILKRLDSHHQQLLLLWAQQEYLRERNNNLLQDIRNLHREAWEVLYYMQQETIFS